MISHKHIIFFTDNTESDDVKKLYQIISDNSEHCHTMDSRKFGMGWSEHHYSLGGDFTYFILPGSWEYFGVGEGWNYPIDKTFKDFKIVAKMDEQMDYSKPNKFEEETIESFNLISKKMGINNIYVVVFDDSSSGGLKYHKILNPWKGNFYDKRKNRDKKLKDIGI